MGYDEKRKGWKCFDPQTGKCYTSKNVVFDESSSWWSAESVVLLDSKEIEESLQKHDETDRIEQTMEEERIDDVSGFQLPESSMSPWQTRNDNKTIEEERPNQYEELEEPKEQLRRSARKRRSNPKYANVALMEDDGPKEPTSFQDASKIDEWIQAMEEEIEALKKNETWELVPKPKDVRPITC